MLFITQASDVAKQAKVAELLGHDFVARGRGTGKEQSLFSPTENVVYEKTDHGGEEVHIGVDWTRDRDSVSFLLQ
jgi:hypothetical protein